MHVDVAAWAKLVQRTLPKLARRLGSTVLFYLDPVCIILKYLLSLFHWALTVSLHWSSCELIQHVHLIP